MQKMTGSKIWKKFVDYLFVLAGTAIYALGVHVFTVPNQIAPGRCHRTGNRCQGLNKSSDWYFCFGHQHPPDFGRAEISWPRFYSENFSFYRFFYFFDRLCLSMDPRLSGEHSAGGFVRRRADRAWHCGSLHPQRLYRRNRYHQPYDSEKIPAFSDRESGFTV